MTMALYLIRHAKAASRREWTGDDRDRPLIESGTMQADALAERLGRVRPARLVSSPFVRCVQTLEPLAARMGLPVETEEALGEGADLAQVVKVLMSVPDRAVLCSHGDVIPDVIGILERRGMVIEGEPNWRKGSVWVLERDDSGSDDAFSRALAWPPPD
jgi:8-oxo-dGTP diphosphatase